MSKVSDQHSNRGYWGIALYCPEKSTNVGTVLRNTYAMGGAFVAIIAGKYYRQGSDTCKAEFKIPVMEYPTWEAFLESKPIDAKIVCIEITPNATDICRACHPRSAVYVLGPEGGSLPEKATGKFPVWKIPSRCCLNLATAATVVMYDRTMKAQRGTELE